MGTCGQSFSSGVADVIKVKSHLEDVGYHAKQDRLPPHANSLADVVAEEAAKRLLPDLNLERKAKKAERIGIGVAKRLALVQADIWAKRGAAGDKNELEPLLAVEETCTRSAIGKLVDELAQQGHLLVRHNKGLKCKACNVYRADRQLSFWNRTPCVPRPCAAEVISQFRNKKRQHNTYTDDWAYGKSAFPCFVSLKVTLHTLNNSVLPPLLLKSVSSGKEVGMFRRSGTFVAWMRRDTHVILVNTPIVAAGPRASSRSNADDPEEWELPCSDGESVCWDEAHRTEPVACRPIIKCGMTGCTGSCPTSVVGHGYTAEKEPDTCEMCGKTHWVSRNVLPREQ